MTMANRDTQDPGDGGAAAIVAGLLVVVAVMVGIFFCVGFDSAQPHGIDLDVKPIVVGSTAGR